MRSIKIFEATPFLNLGVFTRFQNYEFRHVWPGVIGATITVCQQFPITKIPAQNAAQIMSNDDIRSARQDAKMELNAARESNIEGA